MNPRIKKNYTSLGTPVPHLTRYCFGATVKAARERARWSQAECSGRIGMTSTWWCHLEQGRKPKQPVRGKQLALAARGLGMTQVALLKLCMEEELDAPLDEAWGRVARLAVLRGLTPNLVEKLIRAAPEGPPLAMPDTGLVDPEAPPSPMEDMAAYRARMDRAAQVERERLYQDRRALAAREAMTEPAGMLASRPEIVAPQPAVRPVLGAVVDAAFDDEELAPSPCCSMVWPVLDGDTCAPSGMHSCTQPEGHEHDHACKCGDLR